MDGAQVHYFGFGSLVNRATRPPGEPCVNASLAGFRRAWNHRIGVERHAAGESVGRGCTSLSIDPDPGSTIEGVIVAMPSDLLPSLDRREAGYERLSLPSSRFRVDPAAAEAIGLYPGSSSGEAVTVHVYRSREAYRLAPDVPHPILRSYVDCVLAGYLERFGSDGVEAFIRSTGGWDGGLHDDRACPEYPRAVTLRDLERDEIERRLAELPAGCHHRPA